LDFIKIEIKTLRPLLLERNIKVKGYDIDVMGIVNNIVYVRWFEDLRHYFLDMYWPYADMLGQNQSPILSKLEIEYKYPLTILEHPVGRIWVSSLSRAKWEMGFEIITGKKLNCIGKQSGYIYDLRRKKPVAIPDHLKEKYDASLAALSEKL
jgi:acyl-CoA thioester hydrolase